MNRYFIYYISEEQIDLCNSDYDYETVIKHLEIACSDKLNELFFIFIDILNSNDLLGYFFVVDTFSKKILSIKDVQEHQPLYEF